MTRLTMMKTWALILALCVSMSINADESNSETVSVTGKIKVEKTDKKVDWANANGTLYNRPTYPRIDLPDNYRQMSSVERRDWLTKFYATDEGKAYKKAVEEARANVIRKSFKLKKDGSFKVDGIKPGDKYTLSITLADPKSEGPRKDNIIQFGKTITVGKEDVKLGELTTMIIKNVAVGDKAPQFSFKDVKGKEHKLADFKGKFVLVDFWAVWCGPCRGETPNLKKTYDKFSKNPNFAMIGLSLDQQTKEPIEYAKKNDLQWINGFLGKWSDDKVTKLYNVRGIPSIWLIGPDGKVLEKGLRGDRIHDAVEKHLKNFEKKA